MIRMKWQRRIWLTLATLAFLWLAFGLSATSAAVESNLNSPKAENIGYQLGTAIGGGIGLSITVCTGLPFLLFSLLMGWRNGVGMRNETRHRQMLQIRGLRTIEQLS